MALSSSVLEDDASPEPFLSSDPWDLEYPPFPVSNEQDVDLTDIGAQFDNVHDDMISTCGLSQETMAEIYFPDYLTDTCWEETFYTEDVTTSDVSPELELNFEFESVPDLCMDTDRELSSKPESNTEYDYEFDPEYGLEFEPELTIDLELDLEFGTELAPAILEYVAWPFSSRADEFTRHQNILEEL
jgi:hypothetical protein